MACAQNANVCTMTLGAIAQFVIIIFAIVACVLEIGGPCWTWQSQSAERSDEGAQARPRDRAEPIAPAQPMPTPPRKPNCIDNPWPGGGTAPQWQTDFPPVSNAELGRIIEARFQPTDQRPGGTAGDIRREKVPGKHTQKGRDRVRQLRGLLKSGKLNSYDASLAKWLYQDLLNALNGC